MSHRRKQRISIAVPSSLVSGVPHLREKTGVIGQVARAAAIYRVEDIYIFRDELDDSNLIRLILNYVETPQYLRKRLFRRRYELSYVGILPPLRTPHHSVKSSLKEIREGEFREGVILSKGQRGYLVDIGVETPLLALGRTPSIGSRATVRVASIKPELTGGFARKRDISIYWGYKVHLVGGSLDKVVSSHDFDLKIATSRNGPCYNRVKPELQKSWNKASSILVAFGSPRRGLQELLPQKKGGLEETFDFVVNTVPLQGCETVRTEEAIHSTLALFNLMSI